MNFFALVLIALTGTVPAFGQGRDDRNGGPGTSRGNASAVALDYEAIRLERIATVIRIHEKITLDGRLDEPAWSQAIPAADFLQWSPRHGEPAQEPTEVRFL